MSQPRAALSVDVEFFSHLPAYRSAAGTTDRTEVGREGIASLLNAFDDADVTGTFFTVAEVADRCPDLVADISEAGHEVASHTYTHRHLSELDAEQRRSELVDSRDRLEAVTGTTVTGFRAPSFDIAEDHFGMVDSLGYTYDSSVVPCRSIPGWYGGEYDVTRPTWANLISPDGPARLAVVPVAVMPGLRLPLSGTWVRFFGVRYTLLGMRLLARRSIAPVLYVHPWELVDLPEVEGMPTRVYWRTGEYMRHTVDHILDAPFEFVTISELASECEADPPGGDTGR